MARLYSRTRNEWTDVPEQDVQSAYMSGQFSFAKDSLVNIKLPDGRYGTIPEEHLFKAFKAGSSYDTAQERKHREDEDTYEGKNLEALLLAGARGLTFGFSDVALEGMGAYTEEELTKIEDYNSILSGIGEVGGAVLPALLTGGTSIAARAVALTPAGFAAKAGVAAGTRLGGITGLANASTTAGKMLRGGAVLGAEAGVEGILFGAGETFSEELLGRTDLTAEQMISQIGFAGVLGGGIGGILGAGPAAISKAFKLAAENRYSKKVAGKLAEWQDGYTSAMTGVSRENLAKFRSPAFMDEMLDFGNVKTGTIKETKTFFESLIENIEVATKRAAGSSKEKMMRDAVDAANPLKTIKQSVSELVEMRKHLERMAESPAHYGEPNIPSLIKAIDDEIDKIGQVIERQTGVKVVRPLNKETGKKSDILFEQVSYKARKKITREGPEDLFLGSEKYEKGGTETIPLTNFSVEELKGSAKEIFNQLDEFKKVVGTYTYRSRPDGKLSFNASAEMHDAYKGIQGLLEKDELWGAAAGIQRAVNPAFSDLLKILPDFNRKFGTEVAGELKPDSKKIASFLNQIDTIGDANSTNYGIFNDTMARLKNFMEATQKQYGLDDMLTGVVNSTDSMMAKWGHLSELTVAKKEMMKLSKSSNAFMGLTPTGLGYAVGGLPGAAVTRVVQEIMNPGDAIQRRMLTHRMKSQAKSTFDKAVNRATKRMVDNVTTSAMKPRAGYMPKLLAMLGAKSTGEPREDAKITIKAIQQVNNPETLSSLLEQNLTDLHDAPELKAEIIQNTAKQVAYLSSKIPNMGIETDAITGEEISATSDADLAKFMRITSVLNDPIPTIGNAIHDGTLDKIEADAFRENYPILHAEFSESVLANVSKSDKPKSYVDKMMLSNLVGAPLTPTLNPGFIGAMQNVHKAGMEQKRGQRQNVQSLKGSASRSMLPSERAMIG